MENGLAGSFFNYLPEGCQLCYTGGKLVLFITGLCGRNCFYCPVSNERRERDVIFANERRVKNDDDIIEEAVSMQALGTGITGGEPLLKLDRVLHHIHLLRNEFDESHHIHVYTALAPGKNILEPLHDAGLDEIRFHPPLHLWKTLDATPYRDSLMIAHDIGLSVGIEVPAIPSDYRSILSVLKEVDGFLNLNELEFSETNAQELKHRGYTVADDGSSSVLGSKETAEEVPGDKIHFCASRFKDVVQFRERLKRIAKRTARDFDEITDDGTLIYAIIQGDGRSLDILIEAGVTGDMFSVQNGVIETAWWIADDLVKELKRTGSQVSVIERYPMKNGLVVERTPL